MDLLSFFDNLRLTFSQVRIPDVIDLILVWAVVYRVMLLTKHSGAFQILSGMAILALAYIFSIWFHLNAFNWLLENFFANLFLIVVILFQAEIRHALAQIGTNPFFSSQNILKETHTVEELAKAAIQIAQKGYGALIVIEREVGLDYFVELGTHVDAKIRSEMICSIFHPQSQLHDGAIIIRQGRVHSAGCFLPLSKNPILDKNLGTRHRAAIGLTEETDAIVLVVSEENRSVGVVEEGHLTPDVDHATLRQKLYDLAAAKVRTRAAE